MKLTVFQDSTKDRYFYFALIGLTLARVLTSKIQACPQDFDCNAYIQMTQSIQFDSHILPHHAMRVLPSLMARVLIDLGFSLEGAFRILAGATYVLFSGICFWVLRQFRVQSILAFAFTLLCLAPYHAMRIPLQNVYQLCDLMTYPISALMLYFSLQNKGRWIFALSLIGLLTKQTLFGFGFLSLIYCFYKTRRFEYLIYGAIISGLYLGLQHYYQASNIVKNHLLPGEDFFSVSHILWIIKDSKLLQLIVPILPFLILYFKQIVIFLCRYWHVGIYIGVVAGQPFIGYHLTGNNFARLALQGIWVLFLICGILSSRAQWPKGMPTLFMCYSAMIYFSWGMSQRYLYLGLFCIIAFVLLLKEGQFLHQWRLRSEAT